MNTAVGLFSLIIDPFGDIISAFAGTFICVIMSIELGVIVTLVVTDK